MNEIVVLLGAQVDMQSIYARLEEFREGRGAEFEESIESSFENLRAFPKLGPVFRRSIRRLVMPGLQYGIFYSIVGQRVFVHAVLSLRMDKQSIFRKLWGDN